MANRQAKRVPCGAWKSPITSSLVATQSIGLSEVRVDGNDVYWLESRPEEAGRSVILRAPADGTGPVPITPSYEQGRQRNFNVRTAAHSYGGGAWTVASGVLYFSNYSDGRLYRQERVSSLPRPITAARSPTASPSSQRKYADGVIDRIRNRWIGICEDHRDAKNRFPDNKIVAVDLASGGSGQLQILAEGHDFYSSPKLSPDGSKLAWIAWDFPNMPWTGSTLCISEIADNGLLQSPRIIAGGLAESVFQPEWGPDGASLYFISDKTGWWNLYVHSFDEGTSGAVAPRSAEFGQAQWLFGMSTYAFARDNQLIASYVCNGESRIGVVNTVSGAFTSLSEKFNLPFTVISSVRAYGADHVVFRAGAPAIAESIVMLNLTSGKVEVLRKSTDVADDPDICKYFSRAISVSFPTRNGKKAFGFYYAPSNPDYRPVKHEKPPLMVKCHGGPTSAASSALDLRVQYWTSRGIAVLDVNYGGSTGYGRAYRDRLRGKWGIIDVDDCVSGAKYLAKSDRADRRRSVITGASSGGYTALAALTFRNYFRGGAIYYGISDLAALVDGTHKFEAHYLDWLIGSYSKERPIFRARSPVFHASRASTPIIFFQGDRDQIVPPGQTEGMVKALRRNRRKVGYLLFSGEDHGFRQVDNIQRSLEAELYFYSFEVFGTNLNF